MTIVQKTRVDTLVDIVTENASSVVALVASTAKISYVVRASALSMAVVRVVHGVINEELLIQKCFQVIFL